MIQELNALDVAFEQDLALSRKTSFHIGGPAELVLFPASIEQMQRCIKLCNEHHQTPFILGNGSNLLVKDSGMDGVVICTEQLQTLELADENMIYCQAGVVLSKLCSFAQKNSLAGLEFAFGIPGNLGGSIFMNAGAYDGEMKDVVHSVEYIDQTGELRELPASELDFGYRQSVFRKKGGVIVAAKLQLSPGDAEQIKTQLLDITARRREKQPLEFPSAGSVFKRPPGHFAGGLIQQCGLKGRSVGGAQVSEKHAGFIINTGNATAADVRALIALVQAVVEQETGVLLEPEIQFV